MRPRHRPPVLTLAVALALAASLLAPVAASAAPGQLVLFEAPGDLLDRDPGPALDDIEALGARALRVQLHWRDVAPAPDAPQRPRFDARDPAAYRGAGAAPGAAWARYDRLIEAARARGFTLLVTLTGPAPRWATAGRFDGLTRPLPAELRRFATAAARRYGTRVALWSIWNEPNLSKFLAPQLERGRAVSPALYRTLFLAARAGLRAGGTRASVLAGETAPRGNRHGDVQTIAPLAFLRGVLCLDRRGRPQRGAGGRRRCGRLPADGWATHPYTTAAGPFFVPPQRDDVTIGALDRLVRELDRAARAGAVRGQLPVYLTEFGTQSHPDRLAGVSLGLQAGHRAVAELIAWRTPRVRAFSQYLLRDDAPRTCDAQAGPGCNPYAGFESGLRFHAGRPKPSYDGFRLPLVARRVPGRPADRVALWGLVRPVHARGTRVTLQQRDRGRWRDIGRVRVGMRGAWSRRATFAPGRRWRVRWRTPTGGLVTSPPVEAWFRF